VSKVVRFNGFRDEKKSALRVPSRGSGGVVSETFRFKAIMLLGSLGLVRSFPFILSLGLIITTNVGAQHYRVHFFVNGVSLLWALFGTCFGKNPTMAMRRTAQWMRPDSRCIPLCQLTRIISLNFGSDLTVEVVHRSRIY
jgi:hypothetical protein